MNSFPALPTGRSTPASALGHMIQSPAPKKGMCPLAHSQQALTLSHWPKDFCITLISLNHLSMFLLSLTNEVLHFITTKHSYWKKILKIKRSKLRTSQSNKRGVFKHPQSNIFVLENNRTSSNAGVFVQSLVNNQIIDQYRPQCALLISMLGAQRWYQTPAPTSPEQSLLIGQCVLPSVSHSSLGPGFTTAWFSVCKGKSWLQTLPSFIHC